MRSDFSLNNRSLQALQVLCFLIRNVYTNLTTVTYSIFLYTNYTCQYAGIIVVHTVVCNEVSGIIGNRAINSPKYGVEEEIGKKSTIFFKNRKNT